MDEELYDGLALIARGRVEGDLLQEAIGALEFPLNATKLLTGEECMCLLAPTLMILAAREEVRREDTFHSSRIMRASGRWPPAGQRCRSGCLRRGLPGGQA